MLKLQRFQTDDGEVVETTKESQECHNWFSKQYDNLEELFLPYLDFRNLESTSTSNIYNLRKRKQKRCKK